MNRISYLLLICFLLACRAPQKTARAEAGTYYTQIVETLRSAILRKAEWALQQEPITVTAETSERSSGGRHDFFSEGDYWWPDSAHPDSPYVQRDGLTNPNNFVAHRLAMIRFSIITGALASAFKITGEDRYARHILKHAHAWFIDPATRMNPHLLYAQAIKGRVTGRGIGIIDTIHLMEVALGLMTIEDVKSIDRNIIKGAQGWFEEYLHWLTTHKFGKDEMNAENNHGTCWVMQVASFSKFTRNDSLQDLCRERYKSVLLPKQMAANGSFPHEIRRTKPYGYSIFNLDAMTSICQLLSNDKENLWTYTMADGRSILKGVEYLYPYVVDKSRWPHAKDVMYWNEWPVAQPFLVFAATASKNERWFKTWKRLDHSPVVEEVIRNLPVRNLLIWINPGEKNH